MKAQKIWLVSAVTGSGTGLLFILVHNLLSLDGEFSLWEFGVSLVTPAIVVLLVAFGTKSRKAILLPVAYLTMLIPLLGPIFGGPGGIESLLMAPLLGLIGGLFWGTPFALVVLVKAFVSRRRG